MEKDEKNFSKKSYFPFFDPFNNFLIWEKLKKIQILQKKI